MKRVLSSMLSVVLLAVIANFFVAGKEIAIANYFGSSAHLDAFILAFMLPLFIFNIFGGAINGALMPNYMKLCSNKKFKQARELLCSAMYLSVIFLFGLSVLLWAVLEYVLAKISYNFSFEVTITAVNLSYWLVSVLLISGSAQFYVLVLNAHQRFKITTLTPIITPSITLLLLLNSSEPKVELLVVGVVSGALLELVILWFSARKSDAIIPRWYGASGMLKQSALNYRTILLSSLLMGSTLLVDQTMAATLGAGNVATLSYANKLTGFVLATAGFAVSSVILPHFSGLVAKNDWNNIYVSLKVYVFLIIGCSFPIVIVLFIYAREVVSFVFERGGFGYQNTLVVSQIQAVLVFQIPFYILGMVGVKLLNALQGNYIIFKVSLINLLTNILGNYILMQYFGTAGIAISTVIVYAVSCGLIYFYLYRLQFNKRSK